MPHGKRYNNLKKNGILMNNLFNFVNKIDPNDHKFINGKINAHSFSLHIFEKLEDAAAVEAATEALAKGTEAFAAQRMNRGIQHALSGQHIETI